MATKFQLTGEGVYRRKFRVFGIDLGWKEDKYKLNMVRVVDGVEENFFFFEGLIRIKLAYQDNRLDVEIYFLGQKVMDWEQVLLDKPMEIPYKLTPIKGVILMGTLRFQASVG